jgi:hypothetical protein
MPTKKPPTRRQLDKAFREGLKKTTNVYTKSRQIESLLADPQSTKTVVYALQAVLIDMSNERGRGVDMAGVAGAFYRAVAFELADSDDIHVQRCFRHLDVLLSKPNLVTAKALIKYWDDNKSADLKRDPFPTVSKAKNRL